MLEPEGVRHGSAESVAGPEPRLYQDPMNVVRHLALFVTERCNLACPYCFAANMEGRHIDPQVARTAMDTLLFRQDNPAKKVDITWWGGEPLAAFDLLRALMVYAEQRAAETDRTVSFGMPTNLTLLTAPILDFLIEHRVGVSLSLDGDEKAQSTRRLRGGGSSFPIVLDKLELLRSRLGKRMPGVRMTVAPDNVADMAHNVAFLLGQGLRHFNIAAVLEAEWSDDECALYESEQRRLVDHWVAALRSGTPWHATVWNKTLARREMRRNGMNDGTPGVFCGAGARSLAVDIYGDIFPCHRYTFYDKLERGQALGNVVNLSVSGREPPRMELDLTRVRVVSKSPGACGAPAVCEQLCPAVNFAVTGDPCAIPEQVARLTAIDERVVDYLESCVRDEPTFHAYLQDVVLASYKWGELSASTVMLLNRIDPADTDELANKAEALLERLRGTRKASS